MPAQDRTTAGSNHDPQQEAKFNVMRSRRHINQSLEIQKVGLCCYDNKRYLLGDGITSYSYGPYKQLQEGVLF